MKKVKSQLKTDTLIFDFGTVESFTNDELSSIRTRNKYEQVIKAIDELDKNQRRTISFLTDEAAKNAKSSIGTFINRRNEGRAKGKEDVFKTRLEGKGVTWYRIQ